MNTTQIVKLVKSGKAQLLTSHQENGEKQFTVIVNDCFIPVSKETANELYKNK